MGACEEGRGSGHPCWAVIQMCPERLPVAGSVLGSAQVCSVLLKEPGSRVSAGGSAGRGCFSSDIDRGGDTGPGGFVEFEVSGNGVVGGSGILQTQVLRAFIV